MAVLYDGNILDIRGGYINGLMQDCSYSIVNTPFRKATNMFLQYVQWLHTWQSLWIQCLHGSQHRNRYVNSQHIPMIMRMFTFHSVWLKFGTSWCYTHILQGSSSGTDEIIQIRIAFFVFDCPSAIEATLKGISIQITWIYHTPIIWAYNDILGVIF